MGLDARVRYTKKVIRESIIELLQGKPFHKLRLTEVCKRAGINRTTFYKYYKDLYDWKEQLEQKLINRTFAIIKNCKPSNITEILTEQFQNMKDNADLYMLISSPNFESNVLSICKSMILKEADSIMRKRFSVNSTDYFRRKWNCYFVIYGCLGVIECWVKGGMQESPKELATYHAEKINENFFRKVRYNN